MCAWWVLATLFSRLCHTEASSQSFRSKFWYFIELKKKSAVVSLWSLPCWLLWLPPSSCQDLSHMWQASKKKKNKKSPQGGSKFLRLHVVNTVSSDFQPGSAGENWAGCMANTILLHFGWSFWTIFWSNLAEKQQLCWLFPNPQIG